MRRQGWTNRLRSACCSSLAPVVENWLLAFGVRSGSEEVSVKIQVRAFVDGDRPTNLQDAGCVCPSLRFDDLLDSTTDEGKTKRMDGQNKIQCKIPAHRSSHRVASVRRVESSRESRVSRETKPR